jgi:hypothetical protein
MMIEYEFLVNIKCVMLCVQINVNVLGMVFFMDLRWDFEL